MTPSCNICNTPTIALFTAKVMLKYDVAYFTCPRCEFIQTEEPYWLAEAYESTISILDIDLVNRNLQRAADVERIIPRYFQPNARFIDYGGGYGMFVRLMRDKGFNFYRQDMYCKNLFAQCFDVTDLPAGTRFDMVTAFEVFEHLLSPVEEIEKMFAYSDSILFSTCLRPDSSIKSPADWFYFVPETGQHISLWSKKALDVVADRFNCSIYHQGNLHLLSKGLRNFEFPEVSALMRLIGKIDRVLRGQHRRKSLMPADQEFIKTQLQALISNGIGK